MASATGEPLVTVNFRPPSLTSTLYIGWQHARETVGWFASLSLDITIIIINFFFFLLLLIPPPLRLAAIRGEVERLANLPRSRAIVKDPNILGIINRRRTFFSAIFFLLNFPPRGEPVRGFVICPIFIFSFPVVSISRRNWSRYI